ncbi:MAG TPA: hypothetical protein VEV83_01565 [Parafilimonas sp.]|nr:hypothetical protein [Parafilimonas sp.]
MHCKKLRSAIVACEISFFIVACNNNGTDYHDYDTTSSTSTPRAVDSQIANMPADSSATKTPPTIDSSLNKPIVAEKKPIIPVSKPKLKRN